MNYDPFQTYNTLGQLYGAQSAMGFQHPAQLSGINPLLGLAQAGIQQTGQSQFGQNPQQGFINPQQLQLASLLATNPLLAVSLLNNPLLAATLHSQQAGLFGGSPFGQQQYPQFGQQQYPQFGQQQHPQFGQQQQYPVRTAAASSVRTAAAVSAVRTAAGAYGFAVRPDRLSARSSELDRPGRPVRAAAVPGPRSFSVGLLSACVAKAARKYVCEQKRARRGNSSGAS
jgi:hypothetical protein